MDITSSNDNEEEMDLKKELYASLEEYRKHWEKIIADLPEEIRAMSMKEFVEKHPNNSLVPAVRASKTEFAEVEIEIMENKRKSVVVQEGESRRESKRARKSALVRPENQAGSSTGPGTALASKKKSQTKRVSFASTLESYGPQ